MKSMMASLVKGKDVDYLEIRLEDSIHTGIALSGRDIEQASRRHSFGGCVRALYRGGWSFVSFNSIEDLEKKIDEAVKQARLIGNVIGEKSSLAPVKPVQDVVGLSVKTDVRSVTLSKKLDLLSNYSNIMLDVSPLIKTTNVRYRDSYTKIIFANSEGSYIEQERIDCGANMVAVASKNGKSQMHYAAVGSSNNWDVMLGLEGKCKESAQLAVKLLDAEQVKSGVYTIIMDPYIAGTFIHEAFGHLSEGDNVYENPQLQEVMKLGRDFGKPLLNVYDTGLDVGVRGYLKYDDEGVPTEKTYLIREGKLIGRLHSRETAGKMNERATGNARAINYKFPPIPRMRNTCIQKGEISLDEIVSSIKDGILCRGVFGGQTNGEMFTQTCAVTYKIENGKIGQMFQGCAIQGNVFETLKNIDMIGNDYIDPDSAGGCGKGGQMPLPTTHGSPSIRVQNMIISGK